MRIGFGDRGQYWKLGDDGQYRNAQGVVYVERSDTIGGGVIVKNYAHIAHVLPRHTPQFKGDTGPFPHAIPSPGGKTVIGAFQNKREVQEFEARTGHRWDR